VATARRHVRPWIVNVCFVLLALFFLSCGADLDKALAIRTRGLVLTEDMNRYVTAPCLGARVSTERVDPLLTRSQRYRPIIACTFTADGMPHEATSEFNLFGRFLSAGDAMLDGRRWVAAHEPLTAYYDPLVPAHSTLSRQVSYEVTSQIAFSIAGLAIAAGLWFVVLRKLYLRVLRWRRKPPDEPIPAARVV
jgi:hypothetical protein